MTLGKGDGKEKKVNIEPKNNQKMRFRPILGYFLGSKFGMSGAGARGGWGVADDLT